MHLDDGELTVDGDTFIFEGEGGYPNEYDYKTVKGGDLYCTDSVIYSLLQEYVNDTVYLFCKDCCIYVISPI